MNLPALRELKVDGKLKGTIYSFKAGDVLPVHSHKEFDIHYSVLSMGSMSLQLPGDEADGTVVSAPLVMNWRVGQEHGATALTDAELVNILKNPPP